MREHVQGDPALAWALEPAERPGRLARLREKAHLFAIPFLLVPLLPLPSSRRRSSRSPLAARAPRRGAARQAGECPRPRARGARGPHRPEPVHGGRPREAGAVQAPDADRGPLRARLHDAPLLQPGEPLRREDDPLRALGLPRREAAHVLREQLRRQHGELHGRLHRQGRLGPQSRLLERRRLPEDAVAGVRRREGRARVQGLSARAPGADTRLALGVRRPDCAEHRAERADPRRPARRAERDDEREWVQSL